MTNKVCARVSEQVCGYETLTANTVTNKSMGPCGKTRWKIRVDGNSKPFLNLWKSFIAGITTNTTNNSTGNDDIQIKRDEHEQLLRNVSTLAQAMNELDIKLKKLQNQHFNAIVIPTLTSHVNSFLIDNLLVETI